MARYVADCVVMVGIFGLTKCTWVFTVYWLAYSRAPIVAIAWSISCWPVMMQTDWPHAVFITVCMPAFTCCNLRLKVIGLRVKLIHPPSLANFMTFCRHFVMTSAHLPPVVWNWKILSAGVPPYATVVNLLSVWCYISYDDTLCSGWRPTDQNLILSIQY